ncbi:MAG: hypothetical protein AAB502_11290, partial [Chloroflexota bacterium]
MQPEDFVRAAAWGTAAGLITGLAEVFRKKDDPALANFVPLPKDPDFMGRDGETEAVVQGLREMGAFGIKIS